jgi:hypothetical protein
MPAIQTRENKVGNWLKKELWVDEMYCRKQVLLTYANLAKNETGEVIFNTGNVAAKWITMPAAVDPAADGIAIVFDPEITEKVAADLALGSPTGDVSVSVLYRGPAVVRDGGLSMADVTDKADAVAVLVANGVDVVTSFSFNSQA